MKTAKTETAFEAALVKAMLQAIREMRASGTIGCSRDCLMANVRPPSDQLDGAPRSTNAEYYYRQVFNETIDATPAVARFLR